jgi:NADH:ubiquinone oxidoreductase subunit 5 (subunit L)/multisubunit Na+/H+ antiporter MnhA subunit
MPVTAGLFLLGAAAISGLPPLNGFASEWLVGLGALRTLQLGDADLVAFAALALPALALIGGLAAACFAKVHGAVFLGSPRTADATRAHEAPKTMLLPMAALALACAVIGLFPQLWIAPLVRAAAAWSGFAEVQLAEAARPAAEGATKITAAAAALLGLAAFTALVRRRLARAPAPRAETWGCGFTAPTPRMQYTASSFGQMLVQRFSWALRPHGVVQPPRGVLPRGASFESHVPDVVLDGVLLPATRLTERVAGLLRPILLQPRIHLHVAFLLVTLVVVLAWRFLG